MKRFLLLVPILSLVGLAAGCVAGQAVPTYTDSAQAITTEVNGVFIIALRSNPTTGYDWQSAYDANMLDKIDDKYQPDQTEGGVVGAGGTRYFWFKALKTGQTRITFTYERSWEKQAVDTRVFTVDVEVK